MRPAIAPSVNSLNPVHLGERDNGRAQGAERDRRRVGDQRQSGGLQRFEAEADQQRCGHRDRRTESRGTFKERSKAETRSAAVAAGGPA